MSSRVRPPKWKKRTTRSYSKYPQKPGMAGDPIILIENSRAPGWSSGYQFSPCVQGIFYYRLMTLQVDEKYCYKCIYMNA